MRPIAFNSISAGQAPANVTMKSSIILSFLLAAIAALLSPTAAANSPAPPAPVTRAEPSRPTVLQVTVDMPASMRPLISDEIARAFADRVADALRRQGCKAKIHYVASPDDAKADQPRLAIHLLEWRTDHVGYVNCTFAADLSSPQGKKDLGLFLGTAMMTFARHDWLARGEQFDDAAREALGDLYRRIAGTHLLPP
jgi:hypothetical protein